MIKSFEGKTPKIGKNVFIAENATVIGDVILEDNVSIWFGAVLRGDISQIIVGENSNIQDNTVIHTDAIYKTEVGRNCVVGHNAILHSCLIEEGSLIGMGAILLNGSKIGKNSIVGAGALVTEGKEYGEGSVIMGSPAKLFRMVREDEILETKDNVERYKLRARKYMEELGK